MNSYHFITLMKLLMKQKLVFTVMGFGTYLPYYCAVAQTNYWSRFYSRTYLTVISMVYCVSELIGSLLAIPL